MLENVVALMILCVNPVTLYLLTRGTVSVLKTHVVEPYTAWFSTVLAAILLIERWVDAAARLVK